MIVDTGSGSFAGGAARWRNGRDQHDDENDPMASWAHVPVHGGCHGVLRHVSLIGPRGTSMSRSPSLWLHGLLNT